MEDERLRTMFATIDAMRWESLSGFFHADIVYERPGFRALRGIDRLLHFYRAERKILRTMHRVENTAIQGRFGAAWGRVTCTLPDGSDVELGFADVYHLDDQLIIFRRTHFFVPAV
jgi:hypothetical protein